MVMYVAVLEILTRSTDMMGGGVARHHLQFTSLADAEREYEQLRALLRLGRSNREPVPVEVAGDDFRLAFYANEITSVLLKDTEKSEKHVSATRDAFPELFPRERAPA